MKKVYLIAVCLIIFAACTKEKQHPALSNEQEVHLDSVFSEYGEKSCFLLYDLEKEKLFYFNDLRSKTEFIPASTFKIPNSLISLSEGVISIDDTIKWDGVERFYDAWNRDLTMAEALPISAVWFYQELARRVGNDKMLFWLNKLEYGNQLTGPQVDTFWLNGDIRITPRQQIEFLRKLLKSELPFDQVIVDSVKEILLIEKTEDYILYAKTGWAARVKPQIGWYVGWVVVKDKTYIFTTNIENVNDNFHSDRKGLTLKSLHVLQLIPEQED